MKKFKTKELISSFLLCVKTAQTLLEAEDTKYSFPKVFSDMVELKSILSNYYFSTFQHYDHNYVSVVAKILLAMGCINDVLWSSAKNNTKPNIAKWVKSIEALSGGIVDVDYESRQFHTTVQTARLNELSSPVKLNLSRYEDVVSLDVSVRGIPFLVCYLYKDGELVCGISCKDNYTNFGEGAKDKFSAIMLSIISDGSPEYKISSATTKISVLMRITIGNTTHLFEYIDKLKLFRILSGNAIRDEERARINEVLRDNLSWEVMALEPNSRLMFSVWESTAYPEYSMT